MLNSEFSNEFDILYNSITSNQAPGLDEYEKSVFLTRGQDDVLKAYFNSRSNKVQQGYDDSAKRQIDFSNLTKVVSPSMVNNSTKIDSRSICFPMPSDLFLYINEVCEDSKFKYTVVPISHTEYDRVMLKPYQYPVKRGVWRLISGSTRESTYNEISVKDVGTLKIKNTTTKSVIFELQFTETINGNTIGQKPILTTNGNTVTIICKIPYDVPSSNYSNAHLNKVSEITPYVGTFDGIESIFPSWPANKFTNGEKVRVTVGPVTDAIIVELIGRFSGTPKYKVRYLKKPNPIILADLTGTGLSIDGITSESQCEVPEELHREILQRAVELAKASYTGGLEEQLTLGQLSQTNIGTVTSK